MYTSGYPDTKACPPTASHLFPVPPGTESKPRPQGIRTHNFVPNIGLAFPEICSQTDRRTDTWVDHNTPRKSVLQFQSRYSSHTGLVM